MLGRLRIRSRLVLLILVPLLATAALTLANSIEMSQHAARASETAAAVRMAKSVNELVHALQDERLLSVGLLSGQVPRRDLLLAVANSRDAARRVAELGRPGVTEAVARLAPLEQLRAGVLMGAPRSLDVITAYAGSIILLLDSMHLLEAVDGNTTQGRTVLALDAMNRANEGFSVVLASMVSKEGPAALAPMISVFLSLEPAARFLTYATPEQVQAYALGVRALEERLGTGFAQKLHLDSIGVLSAMTNPPPFPVVASLTQNGRVVEAKIINEAIAAAEDNASTEIARALGFLHGSLTAMGLAVFLGVAVARSVARPVRRLTRSAERVARLAETELVRVADDDSPEAEPLRLPPVEASGRDELADLARAFSRVQDTAAMLVQRQVASRRNVAQMFGHVGRRTQNLVGRQISLIDRLEHTEVEPERLTDLYRLDHITSRLRRSASSLVVLSGVTGADEHVAPVALGDVVRLGLAEIEDYQRVDVEMATSVRVAPALINDLVLMLAELMENATSFSPPGTRVRVMAASTRIGARITIADHGLGMAAERIAEENSRLARRERLDLVPTEVLGLFVVGRLARRHGLSVELAPTPGGGVTATVDVPARLLTASPAVNQVSLTPRRSRDPHPGAPLAGPEPRRAALTGAAPVAPGGTDVPALAGAEVGTLERIGGVLAAADPGGFDTDALDRATRTLRAVRPWNAFEAPARDDAVPAELVPDELVEAAASTIRPSLPRSSTLNRRVPGKTLEALEGARSGRAAPRASTVTASLPPQPPSAEDARDSLAQFESGVARAMREMDSRDEGSA